MSKQVQDAYIVAATRTPIGRSGRGYFRNTRPDDLLVAAIKSAMIAHLAGKGTKDVTGTAGVARMQRELMERFEEVAYPDGTSKAKAVLFEEYVVQ